MMLVWMKFDKRAFKNVRNYLKYVKILAEVCKIADLKLF